MADLAGSWKKRKVQAKYNAIGHRRFKRYKSQWLYSSYPLSGFVAFGEKAHTSEFSIAMQELRAIDSFPLK